VPKFDLRGIAKTGTPLFIGRGDLISLSQLLQFISPEEIDHISGTGTLPILIHLLKGEWKVLHESDETWRASVHFRAEFKPNHIVSLYRPSILKVGAYLCRYNDIAEAYVFDAASNTDVHHQPRRESL
jgi:hypothetical protein